MMVLYNCGMLHFFFFQAEDGIRDYKVTGVQTCALPILYISNHSRVNASIRTWGEQQPNLRRHRSNKITLAAMIDRKSTRLNSSHLVISYAVFCLKKKNNTFIIAQY